MISLIEGQLMPISFIIFILGLFYQGSQFFRLTRKKEWMQSPISGMEKYEKKPIGHFIVNGLNFLNGPLWKTDPLMMVMTSIFHVCLIVVPVFLLGHNVLLDQYLGVNLWSLQESLADALTIAVLICAIFFVMRRVFLTRVRIITTLYDYFVLFVAVAPFVTGFFAYHQWFDYHIMIRCHIFTGELMLITIPFTKMGHMLFFFLYRFFIGSEYSFSRGSRTW